MMENDKLHLIACHIASFIANENPADAISAVESKNVKSLLNKAIIKRGLLLANIPVVKDADTIRYIEDSKYFEEVFKNQLSTIVKNIKLYG